MGNGILEAGDLLGAKGELIQNGYAFSQTKKYARSDIRGKKLRIKEWDYYCFCDDEYAVALTVADNSYMSLASVSLLDFTHLKFITKSKMGALPLGKLGMPSNCSSGNVAYRKGKVELNFEISETGERKLSCRYGKFHGKDGFACELTVEPREGDNITVAVPFEKKKQFYYNTKVNCLKAKGWFELGKTRHEFDGVNGVLDWGRGVWPYKNKWYWSSLSCDIDGTPFGMNLGYGFGTPTETENTVFYDGKAHKLKEVRFDIPFTNGVADYLKPWKITDDENRLDVIFYPMIDRRDKTSAGVISTNQHQVFGKFYGKVTLDDGTIVSIIDKIGFAEHVINKW